MTFQNSFFFDYTFVHCDLNEPLHPKRLHGTKTLCWRAHNAVGPWKERLLAFWMMKSLFFSRFWAPRETVFIYLWLFSTNYLVQDHKYHFPPTSEQSCSLRPRGHPSTNKFIRQNFVCTSSFKTLVSRLF